MTDTEIIKALECCTSSCREIKCNSCLAFVDCRCTLKPKMLLDLINRQKAEIEELTKRNDKLKNHFTIKFDHDKLKEIVKKAAEEIEIDIKQAKAEAIREFAEKLKHKSELMALSVYAEPKRAVFIDDINNFVKEMVGEDNGRENS